MQVKEIQRKKTIKSDPLKTKEMMDKLRKEHSKLVKGKFEFTDANGGWMEFNYRYFPEDLLMTYKFVHGEICEIPMGIVRHINNTVRKVRTFGLNDGSERGNMLPDRGLPSTYEKTSRIKFVPLDVM